MALSTDIKVGEFMNLREFGCRPFHYKVSLNQICEFLSKERVESWGIESIQYCRYPDATPEEDIHLWFRIDFNRGQHKASVFVALNFMDTYTLALTTRGPGNVIKQVYDNIYFDMLGETIDELICSPSIGTRATDN